MTQLFTPDDFQIFHSGEFNRQISTMRAQVTPKLEAWGAALTDPVSELIGEPMYAHVAKHLRRRTTPPPETWLAFSPNKRGYKKDPVISLVVSRYGLQARVMLKHEGYERRSLLPTLLPLQARSLSEYLGRVTLRDFYGLDFTAKLPTPFDPTDGRAWTEICEKAAKKTRAFDVGHAFSLSEPSKLTQRKLVNCWTALVPIYHALCCEAATA